LSRCRGTDSGGQFSRLVSGRWFFVGNRGRRDLQALSRHRLDAAPDSQTRHVLNFDRNLAHYVLARAQQSKPIGRKLDNEFHLLAVDALPAVLYPGRHREWLRIGGRSRRYSAPWDHLRADTDSKAAHVAYEGIDLADQFLSATQRDQRDRLDLDDVFQLPIGGGLPSVVHPEHGRRHQQRDSVHHQYSLLTVLLAENTVSSLLT